MNDKNQHPLPKRSRPKLRALHFLGYTTMLAVISCQTTTPEETPTKETVVFSAPQEDLTSIQYKPSFEPDYNHLTAQPWVEPVAKTQQDEVDVYPDRLEFPDTSVEVLKWQPGRLVAGAPSQGTGKNAMGFARRVTSVAKMPPKIIVMTTAPAIEDLIQGDVQIQLNPENSQDMDLSKADLDWVTRNLYFNADAPIAMPGEPLDDDETGDAAAVGFFSKIAKAVTSVGSAFSGAAKAAVSVAKDLYIAVTPASVSGSTGITRTVSASSQAKLFGPMVYRKDLLSPKGNGIKLAISGNGNYDAALEYNPGLQLGAKIALPGHNANSEFWLNIDSRLYTKLRFTLELEAAIEAALNQTGAGLQKALDSASDTTQDILNASRKTFLGSEDVKPASSWKKTLYMTKPSITVFAAGPIPVVVTSTFQVDLECGLEAKASIKTDLLWEQNATFKFKVKYEKGSGRTTLEGPTFGSAKKFDVKVTGGGEVAVSCGLIPRVNVLMYDTVGMFAGIRGSLVGRASYKSECKDDPNNFVPSGTVTLGLYGNVGVQIGARAQAPGSSFAGTSGQNAGYDFGPVELWNQEFQLLEKKWEFAKGLGYCTPLCKNGKADGDETDADCGGPCGKCQVSQKCKKNTDCANSVCNAGKCSTNKCGDLVWDGQESDIDCGGPVAACGTRCALSKGCSVGTDCASGFCGAAGTQLAGQCVANHCSDGVKSDDEGGKDCGGATCSKCANGVQVTAATHCASGLWNGAICVGAICDDMIKSGDETGADCGGPTCAARCGFQLGCLVSSDCASTSPMCDAARKVCLRGAGMACQTTADCGAGTCESNVCVLPPWTPVRTSGGPLDEMWAADASNMWAVAGLGGQIIKWNGTAWVNQTNPTGNGLKAIWGTDANNVWAVGSNGTIVRSNGTAWTAQTSGTTALLSGVWGTSATNIWAVGNGGTILRYNGTSWTAQSSGATRDLYAVWGSDTNNVWAVGDFGTMLRWNGVAWTTQASGTTSSLFQLWGTDANNIWTTGFSGLILRYNGTNWQTQISNSGDTLIGLRGFDASNIWATSTIGSILKWDGSSWIPQRSNFMNYLKGIAVIDASTVYVAGYGGTILRSP